MTLNMTETQRLKGVPTSFQDCMKDFADNVIPTLTHWTLGVKLGTTAGRQGVTLTRNSDGMEVAFYDWVTGDPTGTGSTGNPGAGTGAYGSAAQNGVHTQSNGCTMVAINKGAAYFNAAATFMGENGITAIFFDTAGRTGFFRRGETLDVAGGTYQAPILEVFHDSASGGGGCIIIGNWTTGAPTANLLSGAALVGLTSGATATALTLTLDRAPALVWYRLKAQDTYYLSSVTGVNPTGTITGATTGFTSTFSTYTAASGGKLVVTAGQGRYLHGETLNWTGGSGIVEHVPMGVEMASVLANNVPNATQADCSGYLVLEDADRLLLLFPDESTGPTTYAFLGVGKWGEDLRGFGQGECILNGYAVSNFPISNTQFPYGIYIDPRDESAMMFSTNDNFIPTDTLMGGAPSRGFLVMPANRISTTNQDVSYDAGQSVATVDFNVAARESRRLDRFYFGRAAAVTRPEFVLLGFGTGPTPSGFKTPLQNPDGSNYALQLDNSTNGLFLDYTGITP